MNAIAQNPAPFAPADAAAPSRAATSAPAPSRGMLWTGRVLSGLAVLFLTFDASIKLLRLPMAVQGTIDIGYSPGVIFPLGVILSASLILYLIPRTAALGALFLTGYLGGAVAVHIRLDHPLFSHTLFPIYFAVMLWAGLCLRDLKVRAAVLPFLSAK